MHRRRIAPRENWQRIVESQGLLWHGGGAGTERVHFTSGDNVEDGYTVEYLPGQSDSTWIEPPWKMMLSNKAILAVLWEKFPGHPNLLEA